MQPCRQACSFVSSSMVACCAHAVCSYAARQNKEENSGGAARHAPRSADRDRCDAGVLPVRPLAIIVAVVDRPPGPRPGLLSVLAGADRHRRSPLALLVSIWREPRTADASAEESSHPAAWLRAPCAGFAIIGAAGARVTVADGVRRLPARHAGLQRRPRDRAGRAALVARSPVFAVLGSFGVYYVFTTWLDVLLPTGRSGYRRMEALVHLLQGFARGALAQLSASTPSWAACWAP